ncbi:hypothetical protein HNP84_006505 [Thermocatellispora tengchongensis]|uniref:Transposase n=1 Tax=Thermocatellispora tengchongensis TaxID=1073253 RepID=A0A840P5Z8_9ACTN|nr:hypothetical protein [Thermocatellispora tengchongensis]MBB5136754.1 hypothetical protein [Thermocatellispora tengchongensis]
MGTPGGSGRRSCHRGSYTLPANLPPETADAGQVLRHYKGQEAVERRHQAFKARCAPRVLGRV